MNLRRATLVAAAVAGALAADAALAQVAAKTYEHAIRPGKIAEECFKLPAGGAVGYAFEATAPVDFNIHFHRGKDVEYPVKRDAIRQADDRFTAASAEEYCLMWTNATAQPITLKGRLGP
jgi:hypothetical protein